MRPDGEPAEQLSAAERRLLEHLEVIKAEPPAAQASMVAGVVRRARRQRALREPLRLVGSLAGGVVEGIAQLLGIRRRRRP